MPQTFTEGALAPLIVSDFRRMIGADFLWWGTRFMELIILGWLVLDLTDSPGQVALIGFFRSIPFLLGGFISGPVIDRWGRRRVILAAQTTDLLVYIAISLLIWWGLLALWQLAIGAMIVGVAWSLDWPARRALMPDLVGKTKIVDALLIETFTQNVSRIVGPFVAGLLLDAYGALGGFVALALFSLASLLILLGLDHQPIARDPNPDKPSPVTTMIEGLRYVREKPAILGSLFMTATMNFLVFPYMLMLPVFARDILNQGPVGLGILGAAPGAGAFAAIILINYLRNHISNGWIFVAGSASQALVILAFTLSTNFYLSLVFLFLSGIGHTSFSIMQSSIVLIASSDEMRGQAMGTLVLAIGLGPIGQLQMGATADALGAPWAVRISSSLALLAICIIALVLPDVYKHHESPPDGSMTAYAGSSSR
ncbi:MAG: MFS transporter [Chloroflexota bacterium]